MSTYSDNCLQLTKAGIWSCVQPCRAARSTPGVAVQILGGLGRQLRLSLPTPGVCDLADPSRISGFGRLALEVQSYNFCSRCFMRSLSL